MANTVDGVDARFREVEGLVFVIGAQKAGTTWLHGYFSWHPEVAFPRYKEFNYWNAFEGERSFANRLTKAYQDEMPKGFRNAVMLKLGKVPEGLSVRQSAVLSGYRALQSPKRPHAGYASAISGLQRKQTRLIGEACPQYSFLKAETFAEMKSLSPNTKFIYVMREPVARMVSSLKHQIRIDHGPNAYTPQLFADYVARALSAEHNFSMRHSRTDLVLERLDAVGADVFCTFYEHLFREQTIRDMCSFLDISYREGNFDNRVNADPAPEIPIDPSLKVAIASKLSNVYTFVKERFGKDVPDAWIAAEQRYLGEALSDA